MNWMYLKNSGVVNISDIPLLSVEQFREELIQQSKSDKRIISFFGIKKEKKIIVYAVLSDDENSKIQICSADFSNNFSYPSITNEIQSFHVFERELWEEFGIIPDGHPWLKPVRYSFNRNDQKQKMENYPFFKMEGEEVHEVAVGPIHAGVIEPGHFRFMCNGEDVYHLEIQLGYQHRGVEELFLQKNKRFKTQLAESIAGDTVIGHVWAYSSIIESLADIELAKKAEVIRSIALELERVAMHIGDLGALANDVAYLMGNAVCGATRTLVINSLLAICGSRFGRGLICPGGVLFDIDSELVEQITKTLTKVNNDMEMMCETMFSSASVLSRFEKTGIVSTETAKQIGLVGMCARASGVPIDVRTDHAFGAFLFSPIHKMTLQSGDVFARAYIRYIEIKQSISYIIELLNSLVYYDKQEIFSKVEKLKSGQLAISIIEGWRGEIVHIAMTDKNGDIERYKIKDPSFNNWYGLALAVRNNGISDFPLCNKSFNLSYCGNDL